MYITHTANKVSTFQERFSKLCESNPMSASSLAEKLDVSKQTISAWKSGKRSPKAPTVVAIAHFFNVPVQWLMGYDYEQEATDVFDSRRYITDTFTKAIKDTAFKKDPLPPLARVGNANAKASANNILSPSGDIANVSLKPEAKLQLIRVVGKIAKKDSESAAELLSILSDNDII